MDLSEYRDEIDSIDTELVRLFCRRMEVSALIAEYKKANGLPIYDPVREQAKLTDIAGKADIEIAPYAKELYSLLFALSKDYQHKCNHSK